MCTYLCDTPLSMLILNSFISSFNLFGILDLSELSALLIIKTISQGAFPPECYYIHWEIILHLTMLLLSYVISNVIAFHLAVASWLPNGNLWKYDTHHFLHTAQYIYNIIKCKFALSMKKWFGKFPFCLFCICMFMNHLVGGVLWGEQKAKRTIKIPASVGRCLFPWWRWACADVYDDLTHILLTCLLLLLLLLC